MNNCFFSLTGDQIKKKNPSTVPHTLTRSCLGAGPKHGCKQPHVSCTGITADCSNVQVLSNFVGPTQTRSYYWLEIFISQLLFLMFALVHWWHVCHFCLKKGSKYLLAFKFAVIKFYFSSTSSGGDCTVSKTHNAVISLWIHNEDKVAGKQQVRSIQTLHWHKYQQSWTG